jgi:HAD superfamily hydrolase (TIGR01509 family)
MYKAVFFDFDGVIIDSEPLIKYAFTKSCKTLFGEEFVPPVEKYLSYGGDSFLRIMEKLKLPALEMHKLFKEISRDKIDMVTIFPEMERIIKTLSEENIKMAIITGKDYDRTVALLKKFNIDKYFEHVICSDRVTFPKPNPESIFKALESFKFESNEVIMIGDSVADIVASKRANIETIGVTWGVGKENVLRELGADYIIHSPDDILNIVLKNNILTF